jgi:hypothetical protein
MTDTATTEPAVTEPSRHVSGLESTHDGGRPGGGLGGRREAAFVTQRSGFPRLETPMIMRNPELRRNGPGGVSRTPPPANPGRVEGRHPHRAPPLDRGSPDRGPAHP